MRPVNTLHGFGFYRSLGGVQMVLRQHYANDLQHGMQSRFVIYDEAQEQPDTRMLYLGIHGRMSIWAIRARLDRFLEAAPPDVAVYHTAPMRSYICRHDRTARRVVYLHGKGTGLEELLYPRQTWLDGVICVNEETRQIAQSCLPHLSPERLAVVSIPFTPSSFPACHLPLKARPVVLGYSGRILKEHKRIDRLPSLCRHLEAAGVDYRLEMLGDGPDLPWLQSQLAGHSRIRFHGRQEGEDYWKILSKWDVIVFTSDTEGQPVSLLEALSGQVIPVFPKIGSAGDDYVRQIDGELLYEPGALDRAAKAIALLTMAPEEHIARLRGLCLKAVAPNIGDGYFKQLAAFLRVIQALPRVSTDVFPQYPSVLDRLPLGLIGPVAMMRRRLLQALGRQRQASA